MQSTDYLSNEKRARPSGTHSYWYLGRTNLNTQRKTRPDGRINRQHIFRLKKTAKISYEHMLRINAKSQAVTGEPGRAGSSPIAPAATTPQPARRSIANSAAIWRRGINVRLFECSDCSIGASGPARVGRPGNGHLQSPLDCISSSIFSISSKTSLSDWHSPVSNCRREMATARVSPRKPIVQRATILRERNDVLVETGTLDGLRTCTNGHC